MNKVKKAKFASMLAWALIACLTMTSVTPTFTAFAAEDTVTESSVDNGSKDTDTSSGTESGKGSGTSEAQDGTDKSDGGSSTDDGSSKSGAEDKDSDDHSEGGSSGTDDSSDKDGTAEKESGDSEDADDDTGSDSKDAEPDDDSDADSEDADEDADSDDADDDSNDDGDADEEDADSEDDADADSEDADDAAEAEDEDGDDAKEVTNGAGSSSGAADEDETGEEEEEDEEEDWFDGLLEDEFGIMFLDEEASPSDASPSDAVCVVESMENDGDGDGEEDGYFTSIYDALEAAASTDTIRLLKDIELDAVLTIDDKNITLDLNGQKITGTDDEDAFKFTNEDGIGTALFYVSSGASLTITDTEGGGSISTKAQTYTIAAEGGTVTIESGEISNGTASGRTVWIREGSELEVNGGVINCTSTSGYAVYAVSDSSVTFNDAEISSDYRGILANASTLKINGGYIYTAADGVRVESGAKLTMNGGTVKTDNGISLGIYGSDEAGTTTVIINGGTITSGYNAVSSNYTQTNMEFIINGGTITTTAGGEEGAIYMPGHADITITGGNIIGYTNGICLRDGSLTMTGGYIEAKGNTSTASTDNYETGYGIMVFQHQNTVSGTSYERNITVDISGGEIIGTDYAFYEEPRTANGNDWEQHISLSISGGIFKSTGHTKDDGTTDTHPVEIIGEDNGINTSEITISGGFFSDHVEESDYIAEGYMCIEGVSTTGDSGTEYTDCHAVIPHVIDSDTTKVTLDETEFTYDGQPHVATPSNVTIASSSDAEVTLIAGKHYTVSYEDEAGNIISNVDEIVDAGTYYVVITGTGTNAECSFDKGGDSKTEDHTKQDSLDGSVSKSFTIEPATQEISYGTTFVTKTTSDPKFTNELTETLVYGDITYTSSDESVATVAADGTVTIVGAGTTTITAKAAGTNNYTEATASYTLTVTEEDDTGTGPGPAESEGSLDISITDSSGAKISGVVIEIFDSDGNSVGSFTSSASSDIDVSGLSEGTYTIKITDANGYTFSQDEYTFTVSDGKVTSCTIQATNTKSSSTGGRRSSGGGGGGGGSSTSSGAVYTGANGLTGSWIFNGELFTFPDGTHPSNQYLIIDGEVYAFWTNGYAISFDHTQYYTPEAIAAQGDIPTATGTWDLCGWWFQYSDGSYPHNGWEQLSYNGVTYWYYFDVDGWMVDGWLNLDGKTYYLDPVWDGWRGHMFTGWNEIDGYWYYFGDDGALYRNTQTPDGYTVDETGARVEG